MATVMTLLNNVLLGLRKDTINTADTSLALDYHKLVLQWLNQAKDEAEEAHNWDALRTTITVTGSASTEQYALTSAGPADVDVKVSARLLYETSKQSRVPMVWDTTSATAAFRMGEISWAKMDDIQRMDDNSEVTEPMRFSLHSDGTSQIFNVTPIPSGARTWILRVHQPQTALSSTALTTALSIPARPVWLRALFYAQQERGEEAGQPGSELDRAAHDALAAAIAVEVDDDFMTSNWE